MRQEANEPGQNAELTEAQLDSITYIPMSRENEPQAETTVESQKHGDEVTDAVGYSRRRYPLRVRNRPDAFDPSIAHIATSEVPHVPSTVAKSLVLVDRQQWQKAINSELQSLRGHITWDRVPLPVDRKPLPTRFILLRKSDANGAVTRYKARLVVKRYLQGMFEQTIAPVVDFSAVRIALAVTVQNTVQDTYFMKWMSVLH